VKRAVNSDRSTAALFELLTKQLDAQTEVASRLRSACQTQAALASLRVARLGIEPVSVNTLKARANARPDLGGWNALDKLRRRVKSATRAYSQTKPSKGSNKILSDAAEADDFSAQLERAHRLRLRLESAYLSLYRIAREATKRDPVLAEEFARHTASWKQEFGLSLIEAERSK